MLLQVIGIVVSLVLFVISQCGCTPDLSPTERFVDKVIVDVVKPAVGKAIEEVSATSAQIQGGAEVINPGYESELEGFWVTGIKAKISVKATGVAGRLSGSVQGTGKHLPGGNPGVPQAKDPGEIVPSNGAPASNPTPIVE